MSPRKIAIIGERDPAKWAHQGIEASLALFHPPDDRALTYSWVGTASLSPGSADDLLCEATGIWCAPGSPYASTAGALAAIRHARVKRKAFLGTCGGFQHALMEFAKNVLGCAAEHQEMNPSAPEPLIVKLSCSLVGAQGRVIATDPEKFADLLGSPESIEEYHCNYGFNHDLAERFRGSEMEFIAHDEAGQVRAFRLAHRPYFVGTLFQPERRALAGALHPIVRTFFENA